MKFCMETRVSDDVDDVIAAKICIHQDSEEYDAFFVGDIGDVVRKHKLWKSLLPRVQPFYAVKCNDDMEILKTLAQLGTGFDCASKAEMHKVLEAGVDARRIIYANPCKQASHIKYAFKNKVRHMTFDNENELYKVHELHPDAKMVLRILPPQTDKIQCELGIKYGCQPRHAGRLLRVAKQLGVQVVGVSFHVGSGCYDADAYVAAVQTAHKVFMVADTEGFKLSLLDIGGGFPGQQNAKLSFTEIVEVLRPCLDHLFPEESGVQLIAEPGRFFVASAFTLAVSVIASRKITHDDSGEEKFMYYMNDGVYGSFNCILYDHAEVEATLPDAIKHKDEPTYESSLWGPTCDGLDCVIKACQLPRLSIKDWLLFRDMGAYTMSAASSFNGMPKPACYYVIQPTFVESLMNGVGNKSDCALLSYNTQQQDNNNQCARILDKCPILMRAGHVIGEVAIVESQGQSVEI